MYLFNVARDVLLPQIARSHHGQVGKQAHQLYPEDEDHHLDSLDFSVDQAAIYNEYSDDRIYG